MASTNRENHVYLAKLAEQAERYEGTPSRTLLSLPESSLSIILDILMHM